jgi:Cancer susceptibility candidate 1 N-terminus
LHSEALAAQRVAELTRLSEELDAATSAAAAAAVQLRQRQGQQQRAVEWQRYVQCSALPDAGSERAVNTYLSELSDSPLPGMQQVH